MTTTVSIIQLQSMIDRLIHVADHATPITFMQELNDVVADAKILQQTWKREDHGTHDQSAT